jgi:hypothetical protein
MSLGAEWRAAQKTEGTSTGRSAILLDTADHLSILDQGHGRGLQHRQAIGRPCPRTEAVATTIITYEEQMVDGSPIVAHVRRTPSKRSRPTRRLRRHVDAVPNITLDAYERRRGGRFDA